MDKTMIYLFVGDTIEEPGPSQPRTRYTARSLAHRSPPTVFTTSNTLGPRFRSHPDIDGAFQVKRESRQHLVTFSPGLANQRPDTLRLLTFGDTLFDGLLNDVKPPADTNVGLIRLEAQSESRIRVGWYRNMNSRMVPIQHLAQLIEALGLETGEPVLDGQAKRRFAKSVTGEAEQRLGVLQRIGRERRSALIAQGRHLLTQAAYNWAARQRTLFDPETPPISDATLEAMVEHERYPWSPLRQLVGNRLRLSPDSDTWQETMANTDYQLNNLWLSLEARAKELTHRLADVMEGPAEPDPLPATHTVITTTLI